MLLLIKLLRVLLLLANEIRCERSEFFNGHVYAVYRSLEWTSQNDWLDRICLLRCVSYEFFQDKMARLFVFTWAGCDGGEFVKSMYSFFVSQQSLQLHPLLSPSSLQFWAAECHSLDLWAARTWTIVKISIGITQIFVSLVWFALRCRCT